MNAGLAVVLSILVGVGLLGGLALWLGIRLGRHAANKADEALASALKAFKEHRL